MPLNAPLNEELVRRLAPDEATFSAANELAQSSRFENLGVSPDSTWLLGDYAGIGPAPYRLSVDFHNPESPVIRSTSPARHQPDKFSLSLMLKYIHHPDEFGERSPSIDFVSKREKILAAEERKKGVFAKKGGKKSEEKQELLRFEALDAAARLIADLAAGGDWYTEGRADLYEKIGKQINEAKLPAIAAQLKRFALVGKEKTLKDPERPIPGAAALARLEAVYKKTLALLKVDLSVPSDEDYLVEEYLGQSWSVAELKDRGYGKTDLSLLELCYERLDDEGRAIRLEVSNLLDLNTGELHQSIALRPFKGLTPMPDQPSYSQPIQVADAALYPGFLNRKLLWEKNSETPGISLSDALEAAYGHAIPEFEPVIDEFRTQLRNPFAPTEAVLLLRCTKIGTIGEQIVVEDANGARVELRDRRKDYSQLFNLKRAAGMMQSESPALLVRLVVSGNQIVAYPLAMLTPKHHLRIGI